MTKTHTKGANDSFNDVINVSSCDVENENNQMNENEIEFPLKYQKSWYISNFSRIMIYKNRSIYSKDRRPWYKRLIHANDTESDQERKFIAKLDLILITWGCISYCIKSIDQSNYQNAYVSGMKEDLNMQGKDYNWLGTYYTIGYAIMLIPSQIILSKIKATYWLPGCELVWGVLTGLCAIPKSINIMFALRFLIGVTEASSWPGMITVFMNWYTPTEFATRAAVFGAAGCVGSMFIGFMQASIYTTMNGIGGLPGWRWLFVINAIMTVVTAITGFLLIPDTPENSKKNKWFKPEDLEIAKKRMIRNGRVTSKEMKLKSIYKTYLDWKFWVFALAYVPWAWTLLSFAYFNLWLESLTNDDGTPMYTTSEINMIPVGGYGISAVTMIFYSRFADLSGRKFGVLIIQELTSVVGCSILSFWPKSIGLKYFGFFILFSVQATGPIIMLLLAEVYARDTQKRAIITGSIVVLTYANNAWMPLFIWPADEAPIYHYGYKVAIGFACSSLVGIWSLFLVYVQYVPQSKEDLNRVVKHQNRIENQNRLGN
ncbi:putative pantothenate transporter [Ascoidea rubescens DSM 1968]|uniref:Putative pantothenate transporter n=1 Tax=Ascoidea rubescens DSM 1968 TaxID=1344418 RepID=A0A1D2VR46_9ASCO|nr:putative pantothenate transporter [Ascoidea rubescens DSM 1968]ODV64069.1 putative pantothenate transporter [Ascoidea rubescens DSM 1968]